MDQQQIMYLLIGAAVLAAVIVLYLLVKGRKKEDEFTIREEDRLHVGLAENADLAAAARTILDGLGGTENVAEISNDGGRLKAKIRVYSKVDEKKIREAHVGGVLRPSKTAVQVIIGQEAEALSGEMKKLLGAAP